MAGSINLTAGLRSMPPGLNNVPDVSSAEFMSSAPVRTIYISEKHPRDVLESLSELRKSHELCDVTILVNGKQIYAHRACLAACRYIIDV